MTRYLIISHRHGFDVITTSGRGIACFFHLRDAKDWCEAHQ